MIWRSFVRQPDMARPHICFIQSQSLAWQRPSGAILLLGVERLKSKPLSDDDSDGSVTAVLQFAPGYQQQLVLQPNHYCEILMLQGSLTVMAANVAPTQLTEHGYARLTGGAVAAAQQINTTAGAVALIMLGVGAAHEPIIIADSYRLPWLHGAAGSVTGKPLNAELASKILYRDSQTGEQSFLYCAMPQHAPPAVMVGKFTHPVVEEIFTLSGSYVFGDVGRMTAGGYCWWREGQWHGPTGSETGYCLFIRVLGGRLSNQFSTEPAAFSWHPAYRPALPQTLRVLATHKTESIEW